MPVLCVKISIPLTFCAFSKLSLKSLRDVINDRSLSGQDRKIPPALHGSNQIAGFGGFRPLASLEENKHIFVFYNLVAIFKETQTLI